MVLIGGANTNLDGSPHKVADSFKYVLCDVGPVPPTCFDMRSYDVDTRGTASLSIESRSANHKTSCARNSP